jgi:hypothetical protein
MSIIIIIIFLKKNTFVINKEVVWMVLAMKVCMPSYKYYFKNKKNYNETFFFFGYLTTKEDDPIRKYLLII